MKRFIVLCLLAFITTVLAGDRTIWLLCDICHKKIHTDDTKLDKGEDYHEKLTVENAIAVTNTATVSELGGVSVSQDDAASVSVSSGNTGMVSLDELPEARLDNSAVIAGHGNHTKHICKQCYDKHAWEIFRQIDELWESYWVGVKKQYPQAAQHNVVDTSRIKWFKGKVK